jgi:hypothetical protein
MWKEWERNTGVGKEGDKGIKGLKERKKEGEELRYGRNNFLLNFNRLFTLILP